METIAVRSETALQVSQTEVLDRPDAAESPPVLRLRLKKPKTDRKVGWREGTVDNENMGKKKSKCCCIYKKPVAFGESSSEDDEECEHCFGHPEKRRKNMKKGQHDHDHDHEHDHEHDHDHDHEHDHPPDIEGHPTDESSNDAEGPTCSWTSKSGTATNPTEEVEAPSSTVTEPIPIETESAPPAAPMETEPVQPAPPSSEDPEEPTPSPDSSVNQP